MSIRARLALTASFLAFGVANPALAAPQFYAGVGIEYGDTEMTDAIPTDYSGDLWSGSVIAGVRFGLPGNFFLGAEGETTLFTSYETDSFTGDDLDRVWRLRGMGGYDFGDIAAFVAVGGVWVDGALSGPALEDSSDGITYGAGVEYAVNDQFDLRLEVIRDETEFENGTYEWDNTAVRVGALIKF